MKGSFLQYDKNWKQIILRRRIFVISAVVLQIAFITGLAIGSHAFRFGYGLLNAAGLVVIIRVINRREKPSAYKMTWTFLFLISPVAGGMLYLALYFQSSLKKYRSVLVEAAARWTAARDFAENTGENAGANTLEELRGKDGFVKARFLQNYAGFTVYNRTKCEYLPSGEAFWERAFEEISRAQRYIYLEFFIVNPGYVLDRLLIELEKKVKRGVDVRLMYDDVGCFMSLPDDFPAQLEKKGMRCRVFNRLSPALSSIQNNRDHRKIISIDGKTAFTGGVNIGDEYINAYEKHGHWKDAGILLHGEAAWGLTLIFLNMWNIESDLRKLPLDDFLDLRPWRDGRCTVPSDGYAAPYADDPTDENNIGAEVYLQIINTTQKYVYINTPYLILDDSFSIALTLCAKSGVDVRIITPHRPDKKAVHLVTRSYYRELIAAGVRIFEYTSGFNHSKTFVSDDVVATVGTTNLDFRSLFLHFECGVWLYKNSEIARIKADFLATEAACAEVRLEDCCGNMLTRAAQAALRLIAPLL